MKNILKFSSILGIFLMFLTSCGSDDSKSVPEISGVENMVKLVNGGSASFDLNGGDGAFTAKSNEESVAKVEVKGKTVTIMAVGAGKAQITIMAGSKVKVVEVEVIGNEAGVYKDGMLKTAFMATVKNSKGLWLLEKSGNPYDGKRLHLSALPENLEQGKKVNLTVKSFNVDGVSDGAQDVVVEVLSADAVGLKFGETLIITPRK